MKSIRKSLAQPEKDTTIHELLVILKASLLAVIITLICFVIFALVMKLANLQETIIPPVNQAIRILSIAIGGVFASRASRKKGWLKGGLTGLLYIIWSFIISGLFDGKYIFNTLLLSDLLLGAVVGAVGGIIGINID
jgi:putative membrane protein (TIGR04086 family)